MERDYYEANQKRTDKNINFRVREDEQYIRVSRTVKGRISISIHPYLKEEYKKISDNLSGDFEEFIKNKIEAIKGKKIIFR